MLNFDFYGLFDYDAAGGETYEYTSEEFSSLIEGITGNGVSANYLNEFAPTANGLAISIASGAAFIKGRWGYNSAAKTISLSPTTTTQKRIDRIVIELDVASRVIGLSTLVGTATTGTPTAPVLADNQLAICSVLVANGSTTTLTDERVFTYSAAEVQKQLNEIKAKMGNLAFLPLSGGTMTGDIDFGNAANSGIQWTTDNGTRIRIRPYSPSNVFQITMKASGGDEFGALNIDTSGNITLAQPLPIAYGGTGARDAATARANLGAVNKAGDTMTGQLNLPRIRVAGINDYPTYEFKANSQTDIAAMMQTGSTNMWGVYEYPKEFDGQSTRYYEGYLLPEPSTGLTKNTNYKILTTKAPVSVAQGGTGATTAARALTNLGAVPLAGGVTISGNMTFGGNIWASNNKSAGGYVTMWADNEGGNIAIASPNGKKFEIDAYNDTTLRCYAYDDSGNIKGMNFNRTNGDLSIDGNFYRAGGQRVADVQHGSLDVGTSGKTITFAHAFAGVPSVTATGSKFCHLYVKDITATGCTLVSGESNNHVQWIAAY